MKRLVLLIVLIVLATSILGANAQDREIASVASVSEGPPEGSIDLIVNGGFEDGWTGWFDPEDNPAVWRSSFSPWEGVWNLREGGVEPGYGCHGTWQTVDLAGCDPSQDVWVYRAMAIDAFTAEPSMWTTNEGSIYDYQGKSIAYLWLKYENDNTNGIYFDDWYRIVGLHDAAAGEPIDLAIFTCIDPDVLVFYDIDSVRMMCPPKPVELTPRLWFPLIVNGKETP